VKNIKLLILQVSFAGTVYAFDYDAKIYDKSSNKQKLLFVSDHREKTDKTNNTVIHRTFSYPDGKIAVEEEITLLNNKIQKMALSQKQTLEEGSLEVRDGKIYFSYTKNGKTNTDNEKLTDNLVVGGTIVPYLQKNWATVLEGKDVNVRYAALDRKETVGFKFFKVEEKKFEGKDAIIVKMKPSSFLIAAIVDPLYFTFSSDGSDLYEIVGRTAPKIQIDGKWKDLDADIIYTKKK
jgi:hypothetical protein